MKAVLISIKPKWCELIAQGKKTVEVRKTRPNIQVPFKCYIYCTKSRTPYESFGVNKQPIECGGKVIGEFLCDRIDEYSYDQAFDESMGVYIDKYGYDITYYELGQTCLTYEDFENYGNTNRIFGWHITDLVIYDKPKELSEFYNPDKVTKGQCVNCVFNDGHGNFNGCNGSNCYENTRLKIPPQSWCYVEELGV